MTRPRPGVLRTAVPLLALLVAACGHPDDRPTITHDEAKRRTESYFTDTLAALPKPVTVVPDRDSDASCFKNDAPSEYDGRTEAVTSRYLRDVPADHRTALLDAFREHLLQAGFTVTSSDSRSILMHNPKDDFDGSIDAGGDWNTTLTMGFVSPCVWPDGTKPPSK
ncbi:hypothetical protein ACIBCA_02470 [Kitasatospora sp. NPDC051170]|uniref:hypothetical protein n=1 Tax=Kitasatospora sp. NPDC051170 TaxID=3364056 RepID=UPI00378C242A